MLRRAQDLGGEDGSAPDVEESLAEVLAQAGKTDEAAAATLRSIALLDPRSTRALAGAHLRLARIHATAGRWSTADEHIAHAQAHADDGSEPVITVAAARIALGDSRFARARELAGAALADGRATAEVTSEALMVLGRIARREDLGAAEELFSRARTTAEDAGLAVAATRALEELAIGDVQESLRLDRLDAARARAAGLGDLATVAVLDLHEAATLIVRWEPERGRRAAVRCAVASRRFGLATLPKALVLRAAADVHLGQPDAAEEAMAEAVFLAPEDTHLRGEVWGVRAFRALGLAADDRAFEHLERAMAAYALRPNEVTGSPVVGLWVLLKVVVDPEKTASAVHREPVTNRWNRGMVRFAEAVALGRRGDGPAAEAAFAEADAVLGRPVALEWHRLQGRRLVAEAAVADGWGDPGRWVGADLPLLEARGQRSWVAAQRGLLRRSGATVPRSRPGAAGVPVPLRTLGVTRRETDVLLLVTEGCGNREIAARLFLSPRTVEKHVERLLAKTGTRRRYELVAHGARLLAGAPRAADPGEDPPEPG